MNNEATNAAALQALAALDEMLCGQDSRLVSIGSSLESLCEKCLYDSQQILNRIVRKINRFIDKRAVDSANKIDFVMTKMLNTADAELSRIEWLLTQIGLKCGLLEIGKPIDCICKDAESTKQQQQFGGTLIVDIGQAIPYVKQLVNVLNEIKDMMKCLCPKPPEEEKLEYTPPITSEPITPRNKKLLDILCDVPMETLIPTCPEYSQSEPE